MSPQFFRKKVMAEELSFAMRLKAKREASFISAKTAATHLLVLPKHILAMEEDDPTVLPYNIYSINLLKRYAAYLQEDAETILALFRQSRREENTPAAHNFFEVRKKDLRIRSRVLHHALFLGLGLLIIGYLLYKTIIITSPPEVVIYEPEENWAIDNPLLLVRGKADPVAKVKINGQAVPLDAAGDFNQELVLGLGLNKIEISATKRYSRERVITRTVILNNHQKLSLKK